MKIGDDAKEVLSKYDMKDFIFEIASAGRGADISEAAWELTEKYKNVTPEEMLNRLAEVPDFGGRFYYTTDLYIIDGKLYRQSEVEANTQYDYLFWIQIYIINEKIEDVKITMWG